MKVGIIGAGAWGTALAHVCVRNNNDVILWSYDGEYKHFDGVSMPSNIHVTANMSDIKETDIWLIVTPAAKIFHSFTHRSAENFIKWLFKTTSKSVEGFAVKDAPLRDIFSLT